MLTAVLLAQLVASVVLVVLMASRSASNAHPDEASHVAAGEYFSRHWLLPPVGAPEAAASYNPYGMSYLDSGDIVYWFFGAAAAVGERLGLTPPASMRMLQVLLYLALVVWVALRARTFVSALGFLLLSPQLWYVFSYVNGDALPFVLFAGIMLELGWSESGARRSLDGDVHTPSVGTFALGALLGLLALSKLNYLVAILFVGFVLLWLRRDATWWKRSMMPLVIAVAIAVPWRYHHAWVNGFQTAARVSAYAERVAAPELKPSVQASPHSTSHLGLRAKGVPLHTLFTKLHFLRRSFQSFSGLYGWMSIRAVPWIYIAFAVLDTVLLAILMLPVVVWGSRRARLLLFGVLFFAGLVVAQSVYHSWSVDFQPQGRYLFPILPMLFFFWRQCEEPGRRAPALLVTALLGALSLLSFALVGLGNLA